MFNLNTKFCKSTRSCLFFDQRWLVMFSNVPAAFGKIMPCLFSQLHLFFFFKMFSHHLYLFNSLTRTKEKFIPLNDGRILWYNCGPTVYDHSHMGHARSYISLDIIRRILKDYFHYNIFYVMNITDIDDKIIKKARQDYLYQEYVNKMTIEKNESIFKQDLNQAIAHWSLKLSQEKDENKIEMIKRVIKNAENLDHFDLQKNFEKCKDILSDYLDSKYGAFVTDYSIFNSLSREYEKYYFDDMKALNIMDPDVITRVSEFIPQIVDYVQKIINNGYAYESNNSVYFDTVKFDSSPHHKYAKLVPEAVGDSKAIFEGEGILSVDSNRLSEKRNPNDFALWKKSKPGEPFWESPWGKGRPGWHIECSVMASNTIGKCLDIHSGGYDLKFPHHDNEMAQSEAYYDTEKNWVNYFLHTGHLTISGCKMSKSLKNFVTIKEALKKYNWRQIRFAFLLHSWNDTLDYSDNTMHDAIVYDKFILEFFLTIKDLVRNDHFSNSEYKCYKWSDKDNNLHLKLYQTEQNVDAALCDNIDTRTTLMAIKDLITTCYIYLKDNINPNLNILLNIAHFVTRIFKTFGLIEKENIDFGFSSKLNDSNSNIERVAFPFVQVLANFREKVRCKAKEEKQLDILELCDEVRDTYLIDMGVKLEDKEICGLTKTTLKFVDKNILLKEKEEKMRLEMKKKNEKAKKAAESLESKKMKDAQKKIPPSEMFKQEVGLYSKFDKKGIPTHDFEGKLISKSQHKKLCKLHSLQEKRYESYLKSLNDESLVNNLNN